MQKTWRTFLSLLIEKPSEWERIAEAIGKDKATVFRWANGGINTPHPRALRELPNAMTSIQDKEEMKRLILEEFPSLQFPLPSPLVVDTISDEIPNQFYERVIASTSQTPANLRLWTIGSLVFSQMITHLDPKRGGFIASLLRFIPSDGEDNTRSLHTVYEQLASQELHKETHHLSQNQRYVCGLESLPGYAVSQSHLQPVQQNLEEQLTLPFSSAQLREDFHNALAIPLVLAGKLCGCLLLGAQVDDFWSSRRRNLLASRYANCLALAFGLDQTFTSANISLGVFPTPDEQDALRRQLPTISQRIAQAARENPTATTIDNLDLVVWRRIESDLSRIQQNPDRDQ